MYMCCFKCWGGVGVGVLKFSVLLHLTPYLKSNSVLGLNCNFNPKGNL